MYFDSHAHFDDEAFEYDREELIDDMHSAGVDYIVNVGCNIASSHHSITLAERYKFIYAAVGIHPSDSADATEEAYDELESLCSHNKVVAVGEIGLDFHYQDPERYIQREAFARQLYISKRVNLPIIVHSRDAAQDCFDMIKESKVSKGVIHAYSGSPEMALEYIKMGFLIGVGGVLTFSNGRKLAEVVEAIPLSKILIETDSPYLTPVPFRGKRNDSRNLKYVCEKIAQIKNVDIEKVKKVTTKNAKELFKIK